MRNFDFFFILFLTTTFGCSKNNQKEEIAPFNQLPWLKEIKATIIEPCGENCSQVIWQATWSGQTIYETTISSGTKMQCNSVSTVYDKNGKVLFYSGTVEYNNYISGSSDRKIIWSCKNN